MRRAGEADARKKNDGILVDTPRFSDAADALSPQADTYQYLWDRVLTTLFLYKPTPREALMGMEIVSMFL